MSQIKEKAETEMDGPSFWDDWAKRFAELGFDQDYLDTEFDYYRRNEQKWPEGVADYRLHLHQIFTDVVASFLDKEPQKKSRG
jgi:hypothetical protein